MKKILSSLAVIALTVGIVSGSAYALFTDTAEVRGVTISTGNADLKIFDEPSGEFRDNINLSFFDTNLSNLYPGVDDWTSLPIKNDSASHIPLAVTGRLTGYTGGSDWDALKNVIKIKVLDDSNNVITDWKTLAQWASAERAVTGADGIPYNTEMKLKVKVKIDSNAGDEIAGKQLNDMVFTLTGTQIPE